MVSPHCIARHAGIAFALVAVAAPVTQAANADIQRQLLQREQQQTQLRQKMQQQQERALNPPSSPRAQIERGHGESSERARLRMLHEQQQRAMIAPPPMEPADETRRVFERQRSASESAAPLQR